MFKVLTKGCEPKRGSKYSACVDLFASEDVVIGAGETAVVGLGVRVDFADLIEQGIFDSGNFSVNGLVNVEFNQELLDDFKNSNYLHLMLRSSLGKKGLILPNGVGVIDLDYKDEIKVLIHNPIHLNCLKNDISFKAAKINKGDKIAQITLLEHKSYLFNINTETERVGGFGSSDTKEQ